MCSILKRATEEINPIDKIICTYISDFPFWKLKGEATGKRTKVGEAGVN